MNRRIFLKKVGLTAATLFTSNGFLCSKNLKNRPNILWIIAEDMSPHWGCYGETTIETPHIDKMATEGVLFRQAFVTCPVCSPVRSSFISGMYQTKLGAHNHRSQAVSGKGAGEEAYWNSYKVPVQILPQLFQEAGYFTVLGGPKGAGNNARNLAKSDYNFVWDENVYSGNDWKLRQAGQPFFAQIQLSGGKARQAKVPHPVDPAKVKLPPYYPDHPVLKKDWAEYLNAVLKLDSEVRDIEQRLVDEGIVDNTVVFLFTDHGISHLRGKQFLYDEGIKIPLIVKWPGVLKAGSVREDLISVLDVSASSLDIVGIPIPDYMDGQSLFSDNFKPRQYIAAARDRCDETVECIRCIRTERYKYIRNYFSNKPHMQNNRYKDSKQITQTVRQLYKEGKLSPLHARIFKAPRPPEELYDLKNDPDELTNLASSPEYEKKLQELRSLHINWMHQTQDMGLITEPVLEEMGKKHGNKYFILQRPENQGIVNQVREVIELREQGITGLNQLVLKLEENPPAVRFRAAYEIGNFGNEAKSAMTHLEKCLLDESGAVRIAAARALCLIGNSTKGIETLRKELLTNPNHSVRHYAALYFEDLGEVARKYLADFKQAQKDNNDSVQRVVERLVKTFEG
jgi:arylsulfatase A-like enzyme